MAVVTRVATLLPSAATELGFAINVVVVPLTAPGTKVTFVVAVANPAVPVTVFTSALVEARVAKNCPELFVVPDVGLRVLLAPELDKATAWFATRFP